MIFPNAQVKRDDWTEREEGTDYGSPYGRRYFLPELRGKWHSTLKAYVYSSDIAMNIAGINDPASYQTSHTAGCCPACTDAAGMEV